MIIYILTILTYMIYIYNTSKHNLYIYNQEGFGSFRFVSVRGNLKHGRFGSSACRFVSVRVTWRFGSVRVV